MKTPSHDEALALIRQANTLSRDEIASLQQARLRDLLAHARTYSTVYRDAYAHLPDDPALQDLPIMTKQDLVRRMEDWICDPDFSEAALDAYIHDLDNLGTPFMGTYSVSTTSGTTGEPLRMLRDARHVTINGALLEGRLYEGPLLKDVPDLADPHVRFASVLATGGFHAAFMAFEKRRKALENQGITDAMLLLAIDDPLADMVRKLNDFQPQVITGYPSIIQVLAAEQNAQTLRIAPKAILCSAEQLTDDVREIIAQAFSCPVGNVFCSTEGGEVAILCNHGRMHLNSDWVIVEPIDGEGRPVPPGAMSDAMLVTNLTNAVQPVIRYRVDDSVIVHDTPCDCGLPFPYVDVLGRTNDLPEFQGPNGVVRLSPLVFLNAVVDVPGISAYQFVQTGPAALTMRITYVEGASSEQVDAAVTAAVTQSLRLNGLDAVAFDTVPAPPIRAKKGQKMRSFIKDF